MSSNFDHWIARLRDDVIQGEYGHKEGEYTVCPDVWRSFYDHGLTPSQAFRCALDANAESRKRDEAERLTAWQCIWRGDPTAVLASQTLH
jgi:hypothetical protein